MKRLVVMGEPTIIEVISVFNDVSALNEFEELQRLRDMAKVTEILRVNNARNEGRNEGMKRKSIEIALELLGNGKMERSEILAVTKMMEEDLEAALKARGKA